MFLDSKAKSIEVSSRFKGLRLRPLATVSTIFLLHEFVFPFYRVLRFGPIYDFEEFSTSVKFATIYPIQRPVISPVKARRPSLPLPPTGDGRQLTLLTDAHGANWRRGTRGLRLVTLLTGVSWGGQSLFQSSCFFLSFFVSC